MIWILLQYLFRCFVGQLAPSVEAWIHEDWEYAVMVGSDQDKQCMWSGLWLLELQGCSFFPQGNSSYQTKLSRGHFLHLPPVKLPKSWISLNESVNNNFTTFSPVESGKNLLMKFISLSLSLSIMYVYMNNITHFLQLVWQLLSQQIHFFRRHKSSSNK